MDRVVKMTMTVKMIVVRQRHTRLQKEKNKTMREIMRECGGNRNKMRKIMKRPRKLMIKQKRIRDRKTRIILNA